MLLEGPDQGAEAAGVSCTRRAHPRATQASRALAVRLALLAALLLLSETPWSAPSEDGVGSKGPRRMAAHRRLLSEKPAEPAIALFSQAILVPPNGSEEGSGTVLIPGLVPTGVELVAATSNVMPSDEACSSSCRQLPRCNNFWYCEAQEGCFNSMYNLTAPQGGCQLIDQDVTRPGTGRPALLVEAPGFIGGAPLRYKAVEVEGYDMWPGVGFWYRYDYECPDSVSQPGSCGLRGGPDAHAARCDADPDCQVIMYFPDGRDYPGAGQPVVLLKGGYDVHMDVAEANVNLNAILYKKKTAGSGTNGLSAGALAGIIIGVCCGVALVAAAVFITVRRRRQRRTSASKAAVAEAAAKPAGSAGGGSAGGAGGDVCGGSEKGDGLTLYSSDTLVVGPASAQQTKQELRIEGGQQVATAGSAVPVSLASTESVPSSTAGAKLPPGLDISIAAAGVKPGLPKSRLACPAPPPPSLTSSMMPQRKPLPPALATRATPSPPQGFLTATPSPPQGLLGATPPHGAVARRSQPPSPAGHPLLSNLPTYGWQRSIVDFAAIQFVLNPDGSYQELGTGASATVYKVLLNGVEPHAAKVFRLGSDPEMQLYFLEEASLLRLLRHRCIVGFAGVCVADGNGIILMELMEGGDLRARIRELDDMKQRVFGWYQRGRRVALDVACALNYLHSSTYTHFDVKARNVLLSRDLTAKLADVGFARAMRATHHSIEGPTGTFDYMAPELLTGRKCNSSVDVYSFGVLLWELCTGKYPARGSLREPHVPVECPQPVATLMAECLQEDPALRPTAAQLVERLTKMQ